MDASFWICRAASCGKWWACVLLRNDLLWCKVQQLHEYVGQGWFMFHKLFTINSLAFRFCSGEAGRNPCMLFLLWIQEPFTFSGEDLLLLKRYDKEKCCIQSNYRDSSKMLVDIFNEKAIILSEENFTGKHEKKWTILDKRQCLISWYNGYFLKVWTNTRTYNTCMLSHTWFSMHKHSPLCWKTEYPDFW